MDLLDQFDAAAGKVRDALQHEISMRGKPGHPLAVEDFKTAVDEFDTVVRSIEDELDA